MTTKNEGVKRTGWMRRPPLFLALLCLGTCIATRLVAAPPAPDCAQRERLARLQVPFVENRGQLPERVAFSASTLFGPVLVGRDGGLAYGLDGALTETLVAARPVPTATAKASAGVSYFLGDDPRRWQSDLPTYDGVSLGEAWSGVSVVLRAHERNVEKIFTVQPGASVGRIRMRVDGVGPLAIARDGALVAAAMAGGRQIRFTPPVAYQERDGVRRTVAVAYNLHGSTYGFRVGSYDHRAPLVIDPVLQSTYLGGAEPDSINAMAVDPTTGDVLVGGYTYSTSGGGVDGFVARFDPTLTTLLHATYIGGSGGEEVLGIAVHPTSGEVYVAGFTASTDFPGTLAGAQRSIAAGDDGFVARLDPSLTTLLGATYLGGSLPDRIVAMGIHPSTGQIYVAGQSISVDLPGTAGGAQPSPAVGLDFVDQDGFVARFDPTLHTLLQATYLGGSGPEYLHALAIHPSSGEIYVAGQTRAPDFPGAIGGANAATQPFTGNIDGFIARLDPSLTRIIQSTYVGASGHDDIYGIAIHPASGDVYVVGWTDWVDFPGTEGGAQPVMAGETDAFVARLNAGLTELLQATYLGGFDNDYGYGIAIHPTRGDVYVTGETYSSDLPGAAQGSQPTRGGGDDGFLGRLDSKLTRFVQTTYLGGTGDDVPAAVAIQPAGGQVLVAGMTTSPDLPGRAGGSQPAYAGGDAFFGGDGFVTRFPAALSQSSSICAADATTVCLSGGRFAVRATWRVPSTGKGGAGTAASLGSDTGYFWFFDPANIELVVKVLDARAVNGHTWVFYGALSDVEYHITVTDTDTGITKTYDNPSGRLGSFADTAAFADSLAASVADSSPSVESKSEIDARSAAELYGMYAALTTSVAPEATTTVGCAAGGSTLCLNQARFQVTVDWAVPDQGKSGRGVAIPISSDTGYFWFFDSTNVELMVKVLDGRGVNGKFWVFYGALSNVQYTIAVTDTETQTVKNYDNASGTLASVADTSAF
jgi:hypothetical protein